MATLPTFRTWVVGEVVTAAEMNSNVRDAGNFFVASPIAELRQTVAQSIPNGTFTSILFDVEDIDSDNGHSTVTNTSRYTSPTSGWLHVSGGVEYAPNATGTRNAYTALNGSQMLATESVVPTASGANMGTVVRPKNVPVNGTTDYVEIQAYQGSGGALNTVDSLYAGCSMCVRWVHN